MILYAAIALLLIGALLGGAGMKTLGRRLVGPWRPGAAILSIMALAAGLIMLVRSAWVEAGLLLAASLALALGARKRAAPGEPKQVGMGRYEAASILGVEAGASRDQIDEAYRRLIRRAHPDHGGSPGLAAQLNAARAALTQPPAKRGRTAGRGAE